MCLALEDRPQPGHRADLPAGPAGRSCRKRLDLARDAERAHDSVPGLIVANWVEGRLQ
jgi:hypothetical protein